MPNNETNNNAANNGATTNEGAGLLAQTSRHTETSPQIDETTTGWFTGYDRKFLGALMFNVATMPIYLSVVMATDPRVKEAINNFLKDTFGPYAMAYFQLIATGVSAVAALGFQACMKKDEQPNGKIQIEAAPMIPFSESVLHPLSKAEAAYVCIVMMAVSATMGVLSGLEVTDKPAAHFVVEMGSNPALVFLFAYVTRKNAVSIVGKISSFLPSCGDSADYVSSPSPVVVVGGYRTVGDNSASRFLAPADDSSNPQLRRASINADSSSVFSGVY